MNAGPKTVKILINMCLWDDNSFRKAIFQAGSDWVKLNWHYLARNTFLPSFEALFPEFKSAYSSRVATDPKKPKKPKSSIFFFKLAFSELTSLLQNSSSYKDELGSCWYFW